MRGEATVAEATLLEAAQRAGFTVSRPQLKRLRREGLLHPATQQHRIGRRGSETRYPAEAVDQLLGVLAIRQRRRPFDAIRFLAWEQGLWVEHHQLRATLTRWFQPSARTTQHLRTGDKGEDTTARRAILLDQDPTPLNPAAREMLGRLRPGVDRQDFLNAALQLANRSPDAALARDLLEQVTGFSALLASLGIESTLVKAWTELDLPPVSQFPRLVSRASRTQLAAARDYLRDLRLVAQRLPLPGAVFLTGDSDDAIRWRAALAGSWIVLNRRRQAQHTTST